MKRATVLGILLTFSLAFLAVLGGALALSRAYAGTPATGPNFETRVRAQEAIDRVYYSHRIWPDLNPAPKPPFEEMVSEADVQAKVGNTLLQSSALKEFWQSPITAAQLQDEMDRMAKETKAPAVLGELFAALGNDPVIIAECLARPLLADRLIRDKFAADPRFHADARQAAGSLQAELSPVNFPTLGGSRYHAVHVERADGQSGENLPAAGQVAMRLSDQAFLQAAAAFPPAGQVSAVVEEADAFVILYTETRDENLLAGGVIVFPKKGFDEWWQEVSPSLEPLQEAPADAAFTLPAIERDRAGAAATALPPTGVSTPHPANRLDYAGLWTGAETILWGGSAGALYTLNSGAAYSPATNSWMEIPTSSACPTARRMHTAVWTGKEMIVWGGYSTLPPGSPTNTGGRYNPLAGMWAATSTLRPCPAPSFGHTASWSGNEMVVNGGAAPSGESRTTSGRYAPATDTWAGAAAESGRSTLATKTVGTGGDYATLTAAFAAINAGTETGAVVLNLITDTNEGTGTAVLNASGSGSASYTSVLIQPSGGALRTISGATTAGTPLIDLNGADNVTFDGLNSGGNALTISNTTASATSGTSTIRFINGATSNTVANCTVQGSFSAAVATNGGNIYFATDGTTANGNDNNTISNNNIGPAGASLPTKAVYSNGSTTTTAINNSGNVITGNNIYDYFGAAVTSAGVYFGGGTTDCTVSNNKFYQTATRTQTTAAQHSAIWIANSTSGNNFLLSGNTIGYASSGGTGTYTFVGIGAGSVLIPIYLNVGTTTATSVQGNTIAGIAMSGAVSGTSSSASFRGIYVSSGLTTVGNVTGNTIGSQATSGSITFTSSSASAGDVDGMFNFGSSNWTVANNTIGGFTLSNSSTGAANFYGIRVNTSSSVAFICQNNTIGGSVANSIQDNSTAAGTIVQGINNVSPAGTITGNTVRNLTAAGGTGTGTSASVIGISVVATSANHTVSQNTLYSLTNSNAAAAVWVSGLVFGSSTGTNLIARNLVYGLTTPSSSATATVNGIYVNAGTATYQNNMIDLGNEMTANGPQINGINETVAGTDNFYFNSVYIGGSGVGGTANTFAFQSSIITNARNYRDNVFLNARSNGAGTGKHYAIRVGGAAPNPAGLTTNNNVLYATGTGGYTGLFNAVDQTTLINWQAATGQDLMSFSANPQFIAPTSAPPDLHINPTVATVVEGNGFLIASITDDYDGQTRATLTPVDIGADAGNFIGIDLMPPAITYTALGNTASTGDRTLSTTVTDVTGVPTSGSLQPRIYYKKGAGGTWYSSQGSLTGGSGTNGTWDFTIYAADMGGVAIGDTIYYYVIAQDLAVPPNIGSNPSGVTATDVNTVTTPPASPNTYTIVTGISGTKTVCASGCDYDSLTNAGGAFADINSKVVTGNITILIAGDLTAETGANALNQITEEPAGSNFTVTIQPSGGAARTVSGALASGALIKLNGADRVTIDGLNTGGNSLAITNTSTTSPTAIALVSLGAGLGATNDTVRNCSISTGVSAAAGYGIAVGGSTPGTQGADNDSATLENNTITVATNGIYAYGTTATSSGGLDNLSITGNSVTSNTTIQNYGIQVGNALNSSVSQNTVSVTTSGSVQPVAISLETGFVNSTVSRNKVTSALTTATGGYGGRGITVGSGTATSNLTIANNVVYGVNGSNYSSFSNSSAMGIAIGVVGSSATLSTTAGGIYLYYNSVNMAGTYSYATACLTTALYVGTGASALDLRDNVLVNSLTNSNASGTASKNYAIYSAAPNTSYTTINYDDYFVSGTQGVLGYIASADRTDLTGIQAGFGQNLNSIVADPLFNTATNLQPQTGSPLVGAGIPVSVTVDFTGAARSGSAPTIGAYESAVDTVGPAIAYTPLSNTTSTANRVMPITATDASGVPTSGIGLPVLYFRKGTSGAFTANQSAFTGGSGYDCTFDYTLIGGVAPGDTIQYYVAAQDTLGNVSVNPAAGASGFSANPPAVATPPTTPSSYLISVPLSGILTVGSAEPHTSLTNPGGIFEYINSNVLSGNLTIEVNSDLTAETGAVALNQWAEQGAGNYTLTIKPSATARLISGTGTTHLIKLNGADRVTFDGSIVGGTDQSLTISCAGSTQTVFWIGSASAVNGANNITIKNCIISGLDSTGTTIAGILAGSGTTLGNEAEAPNSSLTIQNDWILKAQNGMYLRGNSTSLDQNWVVTGNLIGSTLAAEKMSYRGLLFGNAQNATVSSNTITGVITSGTSTTTGIQVAFNISGGTISGNTISDIKNTSTSGYGCNGMYFGAATTASNLTVANNFIYDVAGYGYSGVTAADNGYGIFVGTGGGYNLYYNSVRLTTNQTAATGITAAINISSGITTANSLDLRDNIFANSETVGTRYAIYCAAASTVFQSINYNDYFPGTGTLGYLGAAQATLAAWQTATGQDANSISADPLFASTTDLHLQPCASGVSPAIGAAAPIAGITVDIDGNARSATTPDIGADETPRWTIAASAGTGGSISPSGSVLVACGKNQLFNITPLGGYSILDVLVDSVSVGPASTYTFLGVTGNHTISATFIGGGAAIGVVPDGSAASTPFTVVRNPVTPAHLDLAWGDSCGTGQTDFAVYQGTLGSWYSHSSLMCSTGGALTVADVTPASGDSYYLIVPVSATAEGSYGTDSAGAQIPQGASPCLATQDTTACP